jgi:uncharacterized protein with HEPN domain
LSTDDRARIGHALEAARDAIRFAEGCDAEELAADRKAAHAVLYAITIVGEALNKVTPALQRQHPEIPWADAIGMRHRIVHGYHEIDYARVAVTLQDSLPRLIPQLERVLETLGGPAHD